MAKSPFQLENYFFTEVSVKANQEFAGKETPPPVSAEVQIGFSKSETDPLKMGVMLNLTIKSNDEIIQPYNIEVQLIAAVTMHMEEGVSQKERERLVIINGASILYGAARETILNLTNRGPWPAVVLPTRTFSNLKRENVPEVQPESESDIAKNKKKARISNP